MRFIDRAYAHKCAGEIRKKEKIHFFTAGKLSASKKKIQASLDKLFGKTQPFERKFMPARVDKAAIVG